MPVTINGNGTITGVSVGGLPDGIVDTDMLAAGAATQAKRTYASGEIVQVVMGTFKNYYSGTNFQNISSTSYVTYGDMKLTITPKFANSKLIFETDINARLDDTDGYVDYQLYNNTNGVSLMSAGIQNFYNMSTTAYPSGHIRLFGDAGYTTAIQLEVRVKVTNGGTLNSDFANVDRLMTVTEIKQ